MSPRRATHDRNGRRRWWSRREREIRHRTIARMAENAIQPTSDCLRYSCGQAITTKKQMSFEHRASERVRDVGSKGVWNCGWEFEKKSSIFPTALHSHERPAFCRPHETIWF